MLSEGKIRDVEVKERVGYEKENWDIPMLSKIKEENVSDRTFISDWHTDDFNADKKYFVLPVIVFQGPSNWQVTNYMN